MYRAPHECAVCHGKLTITQVTCESCGTRMEGKFSGCRFCSLSPEDADFLLTFIRNRGSIKDVERELGISYPTVRAALDNLIAALECQESPVREEGNPKENQRGKPEPETVVLPRETKETVKKAQARRKILDRLARHEITADEAAAQLKKL